MAPAGMFRCNGGGEKIDRFQGCRKVFQRVNPLSYKKRAARARDATDAMTIIDIVELDELPLVVLAPEELEPEPLDPDEELLVPPLDEIVCAA